MSLAVFIHHGGNRMIPKLISLSLRLTFARIARSHRSGSLTRLPLEGFPCGSASLGILIAFALTSSADAAVLLVNGSGILTGATGVNVNGTLYDVEFVDGACATVFDGCDSVDDFLFTTLAEAIDASDALGAQVFVDGSSGQFDSFPNLTFGCIDAFVCNATTPFALFEQSGVELSTFVNWSAAGGIPDGSSSFIAVNFKPDTSSEPFSVYARWTASTVPEPATLSLVGLAVIGVRRWRRRKKS